MSERFYNNIVPEDKPRPIQVAPNMVRVPSESHPGRHYLVTIDRDNVVRCPCQGFQWRGTCRHVRESGLLERVQ